MTETVRTILIVDDDPDFLQQEQMMLEGAGYRVVSAGSRDEAEELLTREGPDLAVVDLMMQQMDDGFALAYHIKKKHPATPVIILTAVASEASLEFDAATQEERSWIKADAFLAKPVRFEQLKRELDRLLPE